MTTTNSTLPPVGYEYGEARRRYIEQYGSTLVMNTYLQLAVACLSVVIVASTTPLMKSRFSYVALNYTLQTRSAIFTATFHMIGAHPILGVGLGGYVYRLHHFLEIYPHNVYLTFWVEIGLLGLAACSTYGDDLLTSSIAAGGSAGADAAGGVSVTSGGAASLAGSPAVADLPPASLLRPTSPNWGIVQPRAFSLSTNSGGSSATSPGCSLRIALSFCTEGFTLFVCCA